MSSQKLKSKIEYKKLIGRLIYEKKIEISTRRVKEKFETQLHKFEKIDANRYVVFAFAGMERITVADIRRHLGDECVMVFPISDPEIVMTGQAGVGKILVATTTKNFEALQRVPSVQRVLIYLGCDATSGKIVNPKLSKQDMSNALSEFLSNLDSWNRARRKLRDCIREEENDSKLSFRASVIRDGPERHNMTSLEIERVIGDITLKKYSTWYVNLKTYDVQILMLVYGSNFVIGMSLFDYSKDLGIGSRNWSFKASEGLTACLKPSVSATLVQFAIHNAPKENSVILDCMCGVAGIPIETSYSCEGNQHFFPLGGEIDIHKAIPQAIKNLASYQSYILDHSSKRKKLIPDICLWNVTKLPLRSCSVDIIVVDLPFGMRCGKTSQWRKLYPLAFQEMARVIRPRGRVVLMTTLRRILLSNISKSKYWNIVNVRYVNMGGSLATVLLADRTDVAYTHTRTST